MEIAEVAFDEVVLPELMRTADADLVDGLEERFEREAGRDLAPVDDGFVEEGFRAEEAELAAAREPIDGERGLAERAVVVVLAHVHGLERREQAGLDIAANARDEAKVELAFLTVAEVHVFALRLNGEVLLEGGEVAGTASEGELAEVVGADVGAEDLDLAVGAAGEGAQAGIAAGALGGLAILAVLAGATLSTSTLPAGSAEAAWATGSSGSGQAAGTASAALAASARRATGTGEAGGLVGGSETTSASLARRTTGATWAHWPDATRAGGEAALGELVEIGAELALIGLDAVELLLEVGVFVAEIAERVEDVVELVELLQDVGAALLVQGLKLVELVADGLDGIADAASGDELAVLVTDGDGDAAIHEAGGGREVGDFGIALALGGGLDLRGAGAVFYKEVADGVGAAEAEVHVVGVGADLVAVAFELHLVGGVLIEELGEAKETGEAIGEDGVVELEVDFFPVVLGDEGIGHGRVVSHGADAGASGGSLRENGAWKEGQGEHGGP